VNLNGGAGWDGGIARFALVGVGTVFCVFDLGVLLLWLIRELLNPWV